MTDDEFWVTVMSNIRRTGVHLTGVLPSEGDTGVGWAYTTGLFLKGKPEICVLGLPVEIAASVLNDLASWDEVLKTGPVDVFENDVKAQLIDVIDVGNEEYPQAVTTRLARALGYPTPTSLQLVWPDDQNRFPWENWDNPDWAQPLLGVPA